MICIGQGPNRSKYSSEGGHMYNCEAYNNIIFHTFWFCFVIIVAVFIFKLVDYPCGLSGKQCRSNAGDKIMI